MVNIESRSSHFLVLTPMYSGHEKMASDMKWKFRIRPQPFKCGPAACTITEFDRPFHHLSMRLSAFVIQFMIKLNDQEPIVLLFCEMSSLVRSNVVLDSIMENKAFLCL